MRLLSTKKYKLDCYAQEKWPMMLLCKITKANELLSRRKMTNEVVKHKNNANEVSKHGHIEN